MGAYRGRRCANLPLPRNVVGVLCHRKALLVVLERLGKAGGVVRAERRVRVAKVTAGAGAGREILGGHRELEPPLVVRDRFGVVPNRGVRVAQVAQSPALARLVIKRRRDLQRLFVVPFWGRLEQSFCGNNLSPNRRTVEHDPHATADAPPAQRKELSSATLLPRA